jgi:hypothetical protein
VPRAVREQRIRVDEVAPASKCHQLTIASLTALVIRDISCDRIAARSSQVEEEPTPIVNVGPATLREVEHLAQLAGVSDGVARPRRGHAGKV